MVITVEPGCYFNPFLLKPAFQNPAQSKYLDEDRLTACMVSSCMHVHVEHNQSQGSRRIAMQCQLLLLRNEAYKPGRTARLSQICVQLLNREGMSAVCDEQHVHQGSLDERRQFEAQRWAVQPSWAGYQGPSANPHMSNSASTVIWPPPHVVVLAGLWRCED